MNPIAVEVALWGLFVNASLNTEANDLQRHVSELAATELPTFDFVDFFRGNVRASGWFSDRFGRPRRHLRGDFFGSENADGSFVLDEKLFYSDGIHEEREWVVSVTDDGIFTGASDSLVGEAKGIISGNTLKMEYAMHVLIEPGKTWQLGMKDYMALQPDGRLHNITHVYKWGIRIGTVSTQFDRLDDEKYQTAGEKHLDALDRKSTSYAHLSSVAS